MVEYDEDNVMIVIDYKTGREVEGLDAVGKILFNEPETAKILLAVPDTSSISYFGESPQTLYYQLMKAGLTDAAEEINRIRTKYSVNLQITNTGRLCAAYYLSDSLVYSMFGCKPIQNINELPAIWQTYGLKGRNGGRLTDSLSDPVFTYWLWHRDPHLALRIRSMQERNATSGEIAYAMFPNMSYDFKVRSNAAGRIDTPEKIGEDLNAKITDYIINKRTISSDFIEFGLDPGGSTEGFLKKDNKFSPYLQYYYNILHRRNSWATGTYAPYNPYVALFSFVKALGFKPYYQFSDGTKVFDLEQLKKIPADTIKNALNSGYLSAWIATFFQEDPKKTLNDDESYAREAVKFTEYIDSISPSYLPAAKYNKSIKEIDETANKIQRATKYSFISLLFKFLLVPATFLLFLLVILLTFEFRIPDYNVIANHYLGFSLTIGIAVLIFALALGSSFYGGLFTGAIIGFGGTWILKLLMGYISPYLTWVFLAIVLAAFIFFIVKLWRVYEPVPGYANLINFENPDFKLREMNALRYAYGSKSINESGDDDIAVYLRSYKRARRNSWKSQFGYVCGGIATSFCLIICLYFLSPDFGGEHSIMYDTPDKEAIEGPVEESSEKDKTKAKKKKSHKSKAKTETASPEAENADVNNAQTQPESEPSVTVEEGYQESGVGDEI